METVDILIDIQFYHEFLAQELLKNFLITMFNDVYVRVELERVTHLNYLLYIFENTFLLFG